MSKTSKKSSKKPEKKYLLKYKFTVENNVNGFSEKEIKDDKEVGGADMLIVIPVFLNEKKGLNSILLGFNGKNMKEEFPKELLFQILTQILIYNIDQFPVSLQRCITALNCVYQELLHKFVLSDEIER